MSYAVAKLLINIINIYMFIVVAMIILSWLISFNVVNPRSQTVGQIWRGLNALTEPVLGPIRRIIPAMGGLDFSPIVLFLGLMFLQDLIAGMVTYPA